MKLDAAELARRNIPDPVAEHTFCPDRRWRFDFAWPSHMLALEFEGGVWLAGRGRKGRHTHGRGYLADMVKYNEAALLGWCVIRIPVHTHKKPLSQGGDLAYRYLERFFTDAANRASR